MAGPFEYPLLNVGILCPYSTLPVTAMCAHGATEFKHSLQIAHHARRGLTTQRALAS